MTGHTDFEGLPDTFSRDSRQLVELVVRGRYPIGLPVLPIPILKEFRDQGLGHNVKFLHLPETSYVINVSVLFFNRAPPPQRRQAPHQLAAHQGGANHPEPGHGDQQPAQRRPRGGRGDVAEAGHQPARHEPGGGVRRHLQHSGVPGRASQTAELDGAASSRPQSGGCLGILGEVRDRSRGGPGYWGGYRESRDVPSSLGGCFRQLGTPL